VGGRGASDGRHSSHVKAVARLVGGKGLPRGTPASDKPEAATADSSATSLISVDFQRLWAGLTPNLVGTRGLHGALLDYKGLYRFCWVNFPVIIGGTATLY
jgi:hypothetical protein